MKISFLCGLESNFYLKHIFRENSPLRQEKSWETNTSKNAGRLGSCLPLLLWSPCACGRPRNRGHRSADGCGAERPWPLATSAGGTRPDCPQLDRLPPLLGASPWSQSADSCPRFLTIHQSATSTGLILPGRHQHGHVDAEREHPSAGPLRSGRLLCNAVAARALAQLLLRVRASGCPRGARPERAGGEEPDGSGSGGHGGGEVGGPGGGGAGPAGRHVGRSADLEQPIQQ